jgi:hypothetical protein
MLTTGQWAMALEIIRHVGPFLGLSFDEIRVLEEFYNCSIRHQAALSSRDDLECRHGFMQSTDLNTILTRLQESKILLPHGKSLGVNLYGLIRFYVILASGSSPRKAAKDRLLKAARLEKAVAGAFLSHDLPLEDLTVPVPALTPRPSVDVGRMRPVVDTVMKWRLLEAAMDVAINHLRTMSELVVFTRCINMTLERNALECASFSIDRVLYGHAGRGSLGLPISVRSAKYALQSLQDKELLSIQRRYTRCKEGKMTLNVAGITALHARDRANVPALELHWSTLEVVKRTDGVATFGRILGAPISGIVPTFTTRELHLEMQAALGNPVGTVRIMEKWSGAPCPLAPETHDGGVDQRPSFEIHIPESGSILYKCWTCGDGQVKPVSHLFGRMKDYLGEFPLRAHRVALSASRLVRLGSIDMSLFTQPEPLASGELRRYPLLTRYTKNRTGFLKQYLRSRGIGDEAYEHFKVRYVPIERGKDRVCKTMVSEFTLPDGAVVALRLRTISKKTRRFTTRGSFGSSLFGLFQADPSKALLIVEGEIDAMACYSFGFLNVVAAGGANRGTAALVKTLRAWSGQRVYLGMDSDTPGHEAQRRLIEALSFHISDLSVVDWSQVALSEPIPTDTGVRTTCKDAADIPTAEQFWMVIETAKAVGRSLSDQRPADRIDE